MARKERNDVDYFPHSVNHGKKMFYLRSKFKNDGYAVWFMLLEHLGKSDYHYLNLSDNLQIMYLSSEFMVTEELLLEIINTLVYLGEFDGKLWRENKILFNSKFIENIIDAYKKRNNVCIDKTSLLLLLQSKGVLNEPLGNPNKAKSSSKVSGNTQSKEEYTIEKETIVDVNKFTLSESSEADQTMPEKPKINQWIKTFDERKEKFRKELYPYTNYGNNKGPYPKEMVAAFFDYWSEPNKSRSRMRWETEKTWDLSKRLSTWSKRDGFLKKPADTNTQSNLPSKIDHRDRI